MNARRKGNFKKLNIEKLFFHFSCFFFFFPLAPVTIAVVRNEICGGLAEEYAIIYSFNPSSMFRQSQPGIKFQRQICKFISKATFYLRVKPFTFLLFYFLFEETLTNARRLLFPCLL